MEHKRSGKRAAAVLSALALMLAFSACGVQVRTDENGNKTLEIALSGENGEAAADCGKGRCCCGKDRAEAAETAPEDDADESHTGGESSEGEYPDETYSGGEDSEEEYPEEEFYGTERKEEAAEENAEEEKSSSNAAAAFGSTGSAVQFDEDHWYMLSRDRSRLVVCLDVESSRGYEWNYSISDEKILESVYLGVTDGDQEQAGVSAGTGRKFLAVFRAAGRDGSVTLDLGCGRRWEAQAALARVLEITVTDGKLTMNKTGSLEKQLPIVSSYSGRVILYADKMFREDGFITAELTEPVLHTFTDAEVKALRPGDRLSLPGNELDGLEVRYVEKKDDGSIEVEDCVRFVRDSSLKAWKLITTDDDAVSYPVSLGQAEFNEKTVFTDELSAIAYGDGETFEDIFDCVSHYGSVTAELTVKEGIAAEVKVLYHP